MSNTAFNPEAMANLISQNRGPAPVHLWNPPFCGNIDMRIAADGTWFYQGSPVGRKAMVRLFASVLRLDDDGCYYLVTPVEKVRIQVDDCPFAAVLMDREGEGREQKLVFTLNTEERIEAGPDNPLILDRPTDTGEPHPMLLCRSNLYALISRNVFYQLAELATADRKTVTDNPGVWSQAQYYPLG